MSFRDDHDAALARAEALAKELEDERKSANATRDQLAAERAELAAERAERKRLEQLLGEQPAPVAPPVEQKELPQVEQTGLPLEPPRGFYPTPTPPQLGATMMGVALFVIVIALAFTLRV